MDDLFGLLFQRTSLLLPCQIEGDGSLQGPGRSHNIVVLRKVHARGISKNPIAPLSPYVYPKDFGSTALIRQYLAVGRESKSDGGGSTETVIPRLPALSTVTCNKSKSPKRGICLIIDSLSFRLLPWLRGGCCSCCGCCLCLPAGGRTTSFGDSFLVDLGGGCEITGIEVSYESSESTCFPSKSES